jgi:transposase-like protein|tara:strand:- start:1523 stop:1669 length:147 start_codon:yes stop_codon:yes gene_type:complete
MKEWDDKCPHCKSDNVECVDENTVEQKFFYKCKGCKKSFTVKSMDVII